MMCDYDTHWVSLRYGPIEGTVSSSHKIDATFTVSFHRTSDCCYYDHLPDLGVTKLTDASRPYEMIFPKDSIDDPRFHFPVNRHEDDILVSIESHEDPVIYNVTCRCHTSIILIQSYDHGYVSEIERDDMYSDGRGSRYDLVSGFLLDNRFWDWPLSVERKFVRRYL